MRFYKIKELFANIIFPPKCISCHTLIDISQNAWESDCICQKCRQKFEIAKAKVCYDCNKSVSKCVCGIDKRGVDIDALPKVMFYSPDNESSVESKIIYAIKHKNDIRYARFMADELAVSLSEYMLKEGIDTTQCLFTFIPRRSVAICEDGFDQGERLATCLAEIMGTKKQMKKLLVRRGGKEQKTLDSRARKRNIKASVSLKKNASKYVVGKTLIVVDDLVTTGATLSVAKNLLSSAGAKRVICASVGRTS